MKNRQQIYELIRPALAYTLWQYKNEVDDLLDIDTETESYLYTKFFHDIDPSKLEYDIGCEDPDIFFFDILNKICMDEIRNENMPKSIKHDISCILKYTNSVLHEKDDPIFIDPYNTDFISLGSSQDGSRYSKMIRTLMPEMNDSDKECYDKYIKLEVEMDKLCRTMYVNSLTRIVHSHHPELQFDEVHDFVNSIDTFWV